jgi:DNA-binding MarR family transcriptional regulator
MLGETSAGRGWIRQDFDENDRRVRRLRLSRKGRTIHNRLLRDLRKSGGI